ncbi:acetate uptake transporter [Deferribacteraceae bacterium V6Fe1]|nr:acetate uptake transporter [Deferribacteraceae bacterium V6Fe1]
MGKTLSTHVDSKGNQYVQEGVARGAMIAETIIKDTTANPAPLGLMGFGLTTILLNMHNVGLFGISSMILAMGIFYGGLAQIIAGVMEWKKRNTFGTVAFTSYGLFWISLVFIIMLPELGVAKKPTGTEMSAYLFMWGAFSTILWIGTFKVNKALMIVFSLLVVLFMLLAYADATGSHTAKLIAGYEGIVCGISAIYTGAAQIINEMYGRAVLPIGEF